MATILNFLFAVLFFALIGQGHCQCALDKVTITQTQTGKTVANKPEWQVTISNGCPCSLTELKLRCDGFQTVETISSSVLAKSRGQCLINNGLPVPPFSDFHFDYAWDTSFPFSLLSFQPNCS